MDYHITVPQGDIIKHKLDIDLVKSYILDTYNKDITIGETPKIEATNIIIGDSVYNNFPEGSIIIDFDNDIPIIEFMIKKCTIWSITSLDKITKDKMFKPKLFIPGYMKNTYNDTPRPINRNILLLGPVTVRKIDISELLISKCNCAIDFDYAGDINYSKYNCAIFLYPDDEDMSNSPGKPVIEALQNSCFVLSEQCSDPDQQNYWSQICYSFEFEYLVDLVTKVLDDITISNEFYVHFKTVYKNQTKPLLA